MGARQLALENESLREQVRLLEERVTALALAQNAKEPSERLSGGAEGGATPAPSEPWKAATRKSKT